MDGNKIMPLGRLLLIIGDRINPSEIIVVRDPYECCTYIRCFDAFLNDPMYEVIMGRNAYEADERYFILLPKSQNLQTL